jgi:ribonuclease P/MRP protein subunit RPP20
MKDGYAAPIPLLASCLTCTRYKAIVMHAMGAAIPHLLLLATSLPAILPFPPTDIHTDYQTGTIEVTDELVPEDEDEDITYRIRGKSTLRVVVRIGDEPAPTEAKKSSHQARRRANGRKKKAERAKAAAGGGSEAPGPQPAKTSGLNKQKSSGSVRGVVVFAEGEQSEEER